MSLFIFAGISYAMTALHKVIRHIDEHSGARTKTYARLTDSLVTYVMTILMIILILGRLGVDTATIIGSVSIVSIAVGMGAQDLVKDIVAGLFLTYEGVIKVGDLVHVGGWYGRVTDMGIRTTKVSWHGESKIFNNSSVRDFLNGDGDPARMVLAMPISYDADLDEVEAILAEELPLMEHKIPGLVKPPQYENIDSLGESSVNLCIAIYVDYEKRNSALRSLAREIKAMCDRRGIEIPFNQLVLYNGDLAKGEADAQIHLRGIETANGGEVPKADQR
jgi:small conductance mechanosensitive channel